MDIVIHSMGMPFNHSIMQERAMGGSETAAYYKARELARRGHRVFVFTSIGKEQEETDELGVRYSSSGPASQHAPLGESFEFYARNTPCDVLIIQRHPVAFHAPYAAKVCIHEHHDLALHRTTPAIQAGAWQVAAYTTVSEWHRRQFIDVYNINADNVRVVPNGVDHTLYNGEVASPFPIDDHFKLIYQSRPERGLHHLVRPGGIMDKVRDLPVKLYVFGYENTTAQMAPLYERLDQWMAALPNVVKMGAKSKAELAQYQQAADLLIYPTEFEEVSCISAMEAMHAGLPMLASKCGALPETCKDAGVDFIRLKNDEANEEAFVNKLRDYFRGGEFTGQAAMMRKQYEAAHRYTWEASVDALEEVIEEQFAKQTLGGVLRTAIERSDIHFARWILESLPPGKIVAPIAEAAYREIDTMYAFTESDEAYAAHYAKHQAAYYDEFEEKVVGENVTGSLRYQAVYNTLARHFVENGEEPLRVMDYGCAHGHYAIPMAKDFKSCAFLGIDVSDRAVEAFKKWTLRDGVDNANAIRSTTPLIMSEAGKTEQFDVIIAGEVLEHHRNPMFLLAQFRMALKPGGMLILTTPFGRWEHSGTKAFRTGREHLAHYERQDLVDMFKEHEYSIVVAPAGNDASGKALGSYITTVRFDPTRDIGDIDYERKRRQYGARETISACLIVKDSEETLKRALESCVDWVDEIRVFIDPASRDASHRIAEDFAKEFPFKCVTVATGTKSALRDGFDEARNESITSASGDWILWFDADEELRQAGGLHKLARPSHHNGYGFKQIHYSAEPAEVLTTDMPCRFYRNRKGVKFYGRVHEHPETVMGEAVKHSIVRPEVQFLHNGYVDEATRRARYARNLPLVMRDRADYPNRHINAFLLVRDLAQGILFESAQMGGGIAPHHIERAEEAVKLFEDMTTNRGGVIGNRMLVDSLKYYSYCVGVLGKGFDAVVSMKFTNPVAPALNVNLDMAGKFHSREFYRKFNDALIEEITKLYESQYL